MKKILITGSSGFLGSKLLSRLSTNYEVIGAYYRHGRPNLTPLDVTNENSVQEVFAVNRPDIVIHTVALSDPDYCEEHPDETERINFFGTKNVVTACKEIEARLIHISTSGVFNGEHAPYRENDPVCPINKYGESKARAEEVVRTLDHYAILRFDFLFGYNGTDSPNGLINKLLSNRRIEANPIQKRKPLLVDDVATVIGKIIEINGAGIYHLAGPDNITKYELCKRLEKTLGVTGDVYPVEATTQKAKRAQDTSLLTERLAELGVSCTSIEPALQIIREQYLNCNKEGALKTVKRL